MRGQPLWQAAFISLQDLPCWHLQCSHWQSFLPQLEGSPLQQGHLSQPLQLLHESQPLVHPAHCPAVARMSSQDISALSAETEGAATDSAGAVKPSAGAFLFILVHAASKRNESAHSDNRKFLPDLFMERAPCKSERFGHHR